MLIAFLFAGPALLSTLHVSQPALLASGGIGLLLIAIRMTFPTSTQSMREQVVAEPFVFRLAVPSVAGPSVMATELLLMSQEPDRWPLWLSAVVLAWAATAVVLLLSDNLHRLRGDRVLTAMKQRMGMLLVMVAVEVLMRGSAQYLALTR